MSRARVTTQDPAALRDAAGCFRTRRNHAQAAHRVREAARVPAVGTDHPHRGDDRTARRQGCVRRPVHGGAARPGPWDRRNVRDDLPDLPWNVLGGVTWAAAFVVLGHLAGSQYQRIEHYANYVGLGLLALIVTFFIVRHRLAAKESTTNSP